MRSALPADILRQATIPRARHREISPSGAQFKEESHFRHKITFLDLIYFGGRHAKMMKTSLGHDLTATFYYNVDAIATISMPSDAFHFSRRRFLLEAQGHYSRGVSLRHYFRDTLRYKDVRRRASRGRRMITRHELLMRAKMRF